MTKELSDKKLRRRFERPWYRRPFWPLAALVLAAVAGRIALTPLTDRFARQTFARMPNAHISYRDLALFSSPPSIVLSDVVVDDGEQRRVLELDRLELHVTWRDVVRGLVLGDWPFPPANVRVRLVHPWLALRGARPAEIAPEVDELLVGAPPIHLEVVAIDGARVSLGADSARPTDCVKDWTTQVQDVELAPADGDPADAPHAAIVAPKRRSRGAGVEELCAQTLQLHQAPATTLGSPSPEPAPSQPAAVQAAGRLSSGAWAQSSSGVVR